MELNELLSRITPPDEAARARAHERWSECAKPLGSLGTLETAIEDIAALTGSAEVALSPRAVLVLCADERRLLTTAMLSFRNKLLSSGKPTEDVNELLIRLMK